MKALLDKIIEVFEADAVASDGKRLHIDRAPDMSTIPLNTIHNIESTVGVGRPFGSDPRYDEVYLRISLYRLNSADIHSAMKATSALFDEQELELDEDTNFACLVTQTYGPINEGKYKDGMHDVHHGGFGLKFFVDRTGSDS